MLGKGVEYDGTNDVSFQQKRWERQTDLPFRRQSDWRKRKAGLGFKLLLLLLVAVAGYYVTDNTRLGDDPLPQVTLKRQAILEAIPEAPLDVTPPSSAGEKSAATSQAQTTAFRAAELSGASLSVKVLSPAPVSEKARSSEEARVRAVSPPTTLLPAHGPAPRLDTPKTTVVMAVAPKPLSSSTPPFADIQITQSLACLEVEARQCIGDRSVFALHEHNNPHIWMNVHSQSLPFVLKHIYYHEGRKYAEIPLAIKYPRMRTWSNVTLQSATHVGSWRVAIATEDGDLLEQVMFRVTP
jgi:hypothetical protein